MTAGRWGEVKAVLSDVLDADPTERTAILERLCHADVELRATVESLLAMEKKAECLDTAVLPGSVLWAEKHKNAPSQIGAYKVLSEIGRGGMGVVYLGDRTDGEYRKRVAIKLITSERREPSLDHRFRRERQILAQLEHPGIARLLDGGATESGHPYFVMEYVEGLPLVAWCDEHRLTVAERLALFLSVCDAVAYAHQKLIVHRDLKPGNILVTADGDPKLLDFGLARVLDTEADPEVTQGPMMMTVAYASPEQIRGERQTVASDVYSLGVILYELLTAHRPYSVEGASYAEIVRASCEEESIPLSHAASTDSDASDRRATPERLRRQLAGDLETILGKALSKESRRRYPSVDEFAADLRRHLKGDPIHARAATFSYRAGKFLRRHRISVPAAAIATLLIIAFAGLSWWEARRAQRRFNEVQNLAHSVLFEFHDAIEKLPGSTAARQLLVSRALEYLENLSRDAGGDPRLAREIALGYSRIGDVQGSLGTSNLGNVTAAVESYRKAEVILSRLVERTPSDDSLRRDYLRISNGLAGMYRESGDFIHAGRLSEKNLAVATAALRTHPNDPTLLRSLMMMQITAADLLSDEKKYDEAVLVRQSILDLSRRIADLKQGDPVARGNLALAHKKLGAVYGILKRYEESRREYEEARKIDEQPLPGANEARTQLDLSYDYSDLGWVTIRLGDLPGALIYYRKALALRQSAAAADPNDFRAAVAVASSTERIGGLLHRMNELDAALIQMQHALILWKDLTTRSGANWTVTRNLADTHVDLGDIYSSKKAFPRAAAEYEQGADLYAGLRDHNVLPQALYGHIDELKAQADKCRKSDCVAMP